MKPGRTESMANAPISVRLNRRYRAGGTSLGETSVMPNDPFVESAALSSMGPLRYLDVRDQAAFDMGHAPGAIRVPLEAWDKAAKTAEIGFAKTAYWDEALGSLGVGGTATAVAYDTGAMTSRKASRKGRI